MELVDEKENEIDTSMELLEEKEKEIEKLLDELAVYYGGEELASAERELREVTVAVEEEMKKLREVVVRARKLEQEFAGMKSNHQKEMSRQMDWIMKRIVEIILAVKHETERWFG